MIVELVSEMCQNILILSLFGEVPTLLLTRVTMREVRRKPQIFTFHFPPFSMIAVKGKCDPIALKLGTSSSYGHTYSQLQAQLTSINFYRE
jgi:hypothetical protein